LSNTQNNFGLRLRSLIERKGVPITQFAQDVGITETSAHNWLNQAHPPLAKHWPKLAEYFGVSASYVATGTPETVERPQLFRGDTDDALDDPHPPGSQPKTYQVDELPGLSEQDRETIRAARLRHQVRTMFNATFDAAGVDLERLGWLKYQIAQHLQVPAAWSDAAHAAEFEAKLDAAEKTAREEQLARDAEHKRDQMRKGA
jgi:transcriptional regulator with XRE-family HTH domain